MNKLLLTTIALLTCATAFGVSNTEAISAIEKFEQWENSWTNTTTVVDVKRTEDVTYVTTTYLDYAIVGSYPIEIGARVKSEWVGDGKSVLVVKQRQVNQVMKYKILAVRMRKFSETK